jgi:hypothetical protein
LITKERQEFKQTLKKMRLRGLLDLPWDYLSQKMVIEVFGSKLHPDFKRIVRGQPKKITEKMIGQAFGISTEGEDAYPKGNNQALIYFYKESSSEKDGWSVKHCINLELKVVLAYLNLLLYPQKPQRVIVRIASTTASCLSLGRKIN